MIGDIYTYDDLIQITGYVLPSMIKSCLAEQGIAVFTGKDGKPFTTKGLIEAAGGLGKTDPNSLQKICADDIL